MEQNNIIILPKRTRFRAYELGTEGSSFSYFDGTHFILIEARLTENSCKSLINELILCYKTQIDILHITSWDLDHCNPDELKVILENLKPSVIEYPGYNPKTDNGKSSIKIIRNYYNNFQIELRYCCPEYLVNLTNATNWDYNNNVIFWPKKISENSNDNSTIKLFRAGSFSILSLGDVESSEIADFIKDCEIAANETDVMILAHHGADNGFTTNEFLKAIKPKVAVCSSNYSNQYDHPKQEIRDLLFKNNIRLFTTKTGDVIVESINNHRGKYRVINLIKDNEDISSIFETESKRYEKYLSSPMKRLMEKYI
jgi:competence protein ComEC